MIKPPANYYQPSYMARGRRAAGFFSRARFTGEKALQGRFICDTVPPNRGATPEVPEEFSAGQALKERPPSKHFQPEPAFEENEER
ncbi:MAG TPA: hypothetical protein VF591_02195 [Pyrinomonadaceae bacterium]|jgi:hypothetical protein